MTRHLSTALLLAIGLAAASATVHAQPAVGVSINVQQPGVYGRIDIGNAPRPALVYAQPVLIAPPRVAVRPVPVYLYVPPVHQRDWRRHCGRYGACGQPVYFVQDRWVRERYAEAQRHDNGRHRGWEKKEHHERAHEHDRHDDKGHGNGHGDGKGKGKGKGHDKNHGHGHDR